MMRGMDITRRDAVASFAFLAPFLASAIAEAQGRSSAPPAAGASPTPVFVHDLPPVNLEGWQVTVSHVEYPPGRVGTEHHHPGFVLAYVLQGSIVAKISDQGPERTFTVGQMFYEQPGATHEVSRNASQTEPARLLAMNFARKGEPITRPGHA
jgi:quercetin dioxygenase-like cupin family protein